MFLIRDREKSQVNYLRDKGKDLSRCMNTVCPTNIRKKIKNAGLGTRKSESLLHCFYLTLNDILACAYVHMCVYVCVHVC